MSLELKNKSIGILHNFWIYSTQIEDKNNEMISMLS